jgi:hypothetical protein
MVEKGEGTAFGYRGFGDTVGEDILFLSRVVGGMEGEHNFYPVPGIKISRKRSQLK